MADLIWILEKEELGKIIDKLPGLSVFVRNHAKDDLEVLLTAYTSYLKDVGKYTFGIGANINLLRRKYKQIVLEANNNLKRIDLHSENDGLKIPAWEELMSLHEREHLNFLIHRLPILDNYLKDNSQNANLTEVIIRFEELHEKSLKIDRSMKFSINSIKRYFQEVMEKRKEALHYVSTEKRINDFELLTEFFYDAKENFYKKNLSEIDCQPFLLRYISCMHPYIDAEIGGRYVKYKLYSTAFVFYSHVFQHILSSPNIYWNNSEAVYGCAAALEDIIKIYHDNYLSSNVEEKDDMTIPLVELCFLYASRIVYWNDKGTKKSNSDKNQKMPIRKQDRIRFYEMRTYLLTCFPYVFDHLGLSEFDISLMKYADLKDLHEITYKDGIVGSNSVYILQSREIEDEYIKDDSNINQAYEHGKELNNNVGWRLYCNYKNGKYCLNWDSIRDLLHLVGIGQDAQKVHIELKYKQDRNRIREYLRENGVKWFYHFTERGKLSSIKKEGGLLSYRQCLVRGIVMPKTQDMSKSRDIDAAFNLEDFVRVSFCRYLPKIEERKKEDKDLVLLRISTEVAELEDTLFTDMEATQYNHKHGPTFEDLQKVNIAATQKSYCNTDDPDYWQYQSEVMIKGMIPIKYILNIDNPENL